MLYLVTFISGVFAGAAYCITISYFAERRHRRRCAEIDRIGRALIRAGITGMECALAGNAALAQKWVEEGERLKRELDAA